MAEDLSKTSASPENKPIQRASGGGLMDRIVSILGQSHANVARSVNSNMVIAYWFIGREIVEALQGGDDRANYGDSLLDELSIQLSERFGRGFSATNLRHFRLFIRHLAAACRRFITRQVMNSNS